MHNTHQPPKYIQDLIIKFLQKEASADEILILENWLKEDELHRQQFDEINDTFQAAISLGRFTNHKIDIAWQKLSDRMHAPAGLTQPSYDKAGKENKQNSKPLAPVFSFLKIAASIALVALTGLGLWKYLDAQPEVSHQNYTLVQNNADKKTFLVLPDSSVVWLNANSSLEYDADFGKSGALHRSRNVILKGEAFFEVRKGVTDFTVTTENFSIQVKGTKFNVNTHSSEDGSEKATLEEGHIVLQVKGSEQVYDMKPGDQITFNSNSEHVTLQKVDPSHYSAWKEESLVFENSPLGDIISKLENRYKVHIEIDSVIAQRENLTITITDESIAEVLELIRLSSSLKYTIEENQILIYE